MRKWDNKAMYIDILNITNDESTVTLSFIPSHFCTIFVPSPYELLDKAMIRNLGNCQLQIGTLYSPSLSLICFYFIYLFLNIGL